MMGWVVGKIRASNARAAQKAAEESARLAVIDNVKSQVESRFRGRIFIVPDELKNHRVMTKWREYLDEDKWDIWERILKRYPAEPRTQTEAAENEARFWQHWAEQCTVTDGLGRRDLVKHADIIAYYDHWERWILRDYFGATGRVIDPFDKEFSRLMIDRFKQHKLSKWINNEGALSRANSEFEQLNNHGRKAHFEKWGKWFASNIEDAFKRTNKPAQQPSDPVYGDGGFATARDINNLGGAGRRSARPVANDQDFDD